MGSVTLEGVRKFYGAHEAIKGIDLTIADRELVVFVGPSGCGKSTLLRMIAGLEDVDYGTVMIDGVDVTELPPARRGLAMVFQSYALYPHMSAYDNIAYGLRRAGMGRAEVDRRVREAAAVLQIEPLLPRKPRAMSGGQRQRVAIGRAIVRNPKVFLFDEPLSNLDASLRVDMRMQIAMLHHDLNATMIFVTHDQVEAMTLADRIVVLRGGAVEQVGAPLELYDRPRNLFVARFLGSPPMNVLPAVMLASGADGASIRLPVFDISLRLPGRFRAVPTGTPVTLGVRPERVRFADPGEATIPARLTIVEHLGSETIMRLIAAGDQSLTIKTAESVRASVGALAHVGLDLERACLFDADGVTLNAFAAA